MTFGETLICLIGLCVGVLLGIIYNEASQTELYKIHDGEKYYLSECYQSGLKTTQWLKKYYNEDHYTYKSLPEKDGIVIEYGFKECIILKF